MEYTDFCKKCSFNKTDLCKECKQKVIKTSDGVEFGTPSEYNACPQEKRRFILEDAIQCVCTDRNEQYGEPEDNFKVIAEL